MSQAELKCPFCKAKQPVEVPRDSCLAFHKCEHCVKMITPKEGECCVVCSWSDKKCPVSTATSD